MTTHEQERECVFVIDFIVELCGRRGEGIVITTSASRRRRAFSLRRESIIRRAAT